MADLKVDYQLLESIESSLSSLQSEFANIKTQTGAYDGAMGSAAIVSAMNGFSGNWNSHRKSLITSIQSLGKMVSETITQFQKTDKTLAGSLTKK
jgi:hypothetical protein